VRLKKRQATRVFGGPLGVAIGKGVSQGHWAFPASTPSLCIAPVARKFHVVFWRQKKTGKRRCFGVIFFLSTYLPHFFWLHFCAFKTIKKKTNFYVAFMVVSLNGVPKNTIQIFSETIS
jgi:hypothetical protein